MYVRDALPSDLAAIFEIYDHFVLQSVATFDTEPKTAEERQRWFAEHTPERHALLVADSEGGRVLGWAGLAPWSPKPAYARSAEVSVYVAPGHARRGIGRLLLSALIERARHNGFAVLLARIADQAVPSLALHRALGFRSIGVQHGAGEKLGRVLDVELLELPLRD